MLKKKKIKLPPSSFVVTQSNQLIEARYNLPLCEQRLILTMISRIQPEDEDFKAYRLSIKEFAEFIGVDKNSAYRECKKITKTLLTRVIEIEEPGRVLQTGWVSSAEYVDGSGVVNLSFDPQLKPYLLKLKGNFTSYKLEMILSFKSQYTMRIYTLIKQYERLGVRDIPLNQLREMLGLTKNQYKLYGNFKSDLLQPVQRELVEISDLYFEFEEIKYGRRVEVIRFHISSREIPAKKLKIQPSDIVDDELNSIEQSTTLTQLLLIIPEQHRAKKTVTATISAYEKKFGLDYVKRNILYTNNKADKSYAGYLVNALKEDWGHDWQLDQEIVVTKYVKEPWEKQGFINQKEYDEYMYRKQMENYGKILN
jgi:plasmid replication initiation protein